MSYKDQTTTIFRENIDDSYLLEHLFYDPETKVFEILTERVDDWKKVTFRFSEESEHYFCNEKHLLQPVTRTNEE